MRRPDARQPRALADDEFIGEIEIGIAGRAGKTETRPRRESRCSRRCPRSRNKRIRVSEALSCPFLVKKAPCAILKAWHFAPASGRDMAPNRTQTRSGSMS